MDCLRSERLLLLPAPVVDGAALADREGGAPGASPKKSSPSSDSPGFVVFGGTTGALTGPGREIVGSTVFGRGGAMGSSSNRFCTDGVAVGAFRFSEDARSSLAFSWTILRGWLTSVMPSTIWQQRLTASSSSPASSRVDGSGTPHGMTHLLESYFVLIKLSIFALFGTWFAARACSQYTLARVFPQRSMLCVCSSVQLSRSTDLTLLMWVPRPRCIPEHRMHMKIPRFQLAHRGCLLTLQSAQVLLPSSLSSCFKCARLTSALFLPAGNARDIVPTICETETIATTAHT